MSDPLSSEDCFYCDKPAVWLVIYVNGEDDLCSIRLCEEHLRAEGKKPSGQLWSGGSILQTERLLSPFTVPDVLPLVRAYVAKPGNDIGGNLHIVLEEGNIDDQSINFCRLWAKARRDTDGEVLADKLLLMTRTQRSKIVAQAFKDGKNA